MKLFDSFTRTDASPSKFTESTYDYLNRADRPEVEKIRQLIEAWFADYPVDEKPLLKNTFRN